MTKYGITDKIKIRYQLWRYIQPFIQKRLDASDHTFDNDVHLFTLPRSGSTWLAEILLNIKNSYLIDEPLWSGNIGPYPSPNSRCDEIKHLEFFFMQPIPQTADWVEAELFFEKLLKVQISKYGLFMEGDPVNLKDTDTFVFKFCYGNLLLPWLIDKFHIKPIFLIRHPCAVVQSQMCMPHFKHILHNPNFHLHNFKYNEHYEQYHHILKSIRYPEEHLAAIWAINNYYLVNHDYNNRRWLTVAYENLYDHFDHEVARIFHWIEKPTPMNLEQLRLRPSKSTQQGSLRSLENKNQLWAWKKTLNPAQINRILNIVKMFNVDFYDSSVNPNLDILYGQ